MKTRRFVIPVLACLAGIIGLFPTAAFAQEVKLENVSFEQVLTELFGSEEIPGLLDGQKVFQLEAEGVTLTSDEAAVFFNSTPAGTQDFAGLITGSDPGTELRIEGVVEGSPFEITLSDRQVELTGISLSQADFDGLIAELKASSQVRESRLDATVEGRPVVVRIENTAERVRIERSAVNRSATANVSESTAGQERVGGELLRDRVPTEVLDLPERVVVDRIERPAAVRSTERPPEVRTPIERAEPARVERSETERVERVEPPRVEPPRNERRERNDRNDRSGSNRGRDRDDD